MRIRTILLTMAFLIAAPASATTTPESAPQSDLSRIVINLSMSGDRTHTKLTDDICMFGFAGVSESPAIQILNSSGESTFTKPLVTGERLVSGVVSSCHQSYTVEVPSGEPFSVKISPYFIQEFAPRDIDNNKLEINIVRKANDPFPFSLYPEGGPIDGSDKMRIIGHLELFGVNGEQFMSLGGIGCFGQRGYDDIAVGMQLTIKDETGKIIGVSELKPDTTLGTGSDRCKFIFIVDVPESEFYTIESGRRGGLTYSHADLEERDWVVELSLGR